MASSQGNSSSSWALAGEAIAGGVADGLLHRIHPGVYAVGRPSTPREGRWMAAVLAGGDGAVLTHDSAAELWGIRRPRRRVTVEIASPKGRGRRTESVGVSFGTIRSR
jgi:hypothetical protein